MTDPKRDKRITELYEVLCNKSGKNTIEDIEKAKKDIKELSMTDFWAVEGFNPKTNNMGHLSLKNLPIADYVQKSFNMLRFGGRIWWFNWEKSFYMYDADDVLIHQNM